MDQFLMYFGVLCNHPERLRIRALLVVRYQERG
jgi:hypothetical protein